MTIASTDHSSKKVDFFFEMGDIPTCLYADVSNLVKREMFMLRKGITAGAISLSRREEVDPVYRVG